VVRAAPARAEHVRKGVLETTAEQRNEVVDERAGDPMEPRDSAAVSSVPSKISGTDVEMAVRPEHDGMGHVHLAALNELLKERAGRSVVAQNRFDLAGTAEVAAADVEVAIVRAEERDPRLVYSAALPCDELIDKGPRGRIEAQHVVSAVVGNEQIAAAAGALSAGAIFGGQLQRADAQERDECVFHSNFPF
jgi:hypothetical protein